MRRVNLMAMTFLLVIVLWDSTCALQYDPAELLAPAVQTATPPKVDGVLDDACWSAATELGDFRSVHGGQPATEQTHCAVLWDAVDLYIGVTCLENALVPAVQKAHLVKAETKQRDGSVFSDDCVEIFLSPEPSKGYYHLAANPVGTQYDARRMDNTWNGEWSCAARLGEGKWTLELAIPFSTLGVTTPTKGAAWRFNIAREQKPKREDSSLCGVQQLFHAPDQFGSLVFVESLPRFSGYSVTGDRAGKAIGKATFGATAGAKSLSLRLETRSGNVEEVADEKEWRASGQQTEMVELHSKTSVGAARLCLVDAATKTPVLQTLWTEIGPSSRLLVCELTTCSCRAIVFLNGEQAASLESGKTASLALQLRSGANLVTVRCEATGRSPWVAVKLPEVEALGAKGWMVRQGFDKAWATEALLGKEWKPPTIVGKGLWSGGGDKEITLRRIVWVPVDRPRNWPLLKDFLIPVGSSQVLYPLLEVPSSIALGEYHVVVDVPLWLRLTAVDDVAGAQGSILGERTVGSKRQYDIVIYNPTGSGMELSIRWGDAEKNTIAYVPGLRVGGTFDWRRVRGSLRAPDNARWVHPLLIKWQERGVIGTAWFDHIVIREKGTTANLLAIGTFEEPYWQDHKNSHVVEVERNGERTRCCRLSGTAGTDKLQDAMWVGDPIPIKLGVEYELEALARCENVYSEQVKPRLALLVRHEGAKSVEGQIRFGFRCADGYMAELPAAIAVKSLPPLLKKRPRESRIMPCYYSDCFGEAASRALVQNVLDSGIGGLYGGLHNQVCKAAQAKGARIAWSFPYNSWQILPAPDWSKTHPDRVAITYEGKRDPNTICPTYALSPGNEFLPLLRKWTLTSVKGCGYDEIDCDYEVPVVDPPTFCFCNRCLEAFRQEARLPAEEKLSPEIVVEKHRNQWTAFRCRQNAEMIGLLARTIREAEPKMTVTAYSGYQSKYTREHYGVDWSLLAPHIDEGIAGYNGGRQALQETVKALGNVPFVGGEMYYLDSVSDATGSLPREGWKLRLLRAYVNGGCNGVLIWWLPTMDGSAFFQTSQAAAIIADFEDFFRKGQRADDRIQFGPEAEAEDYAAFEKNNKILVLLFNPTQRKRVVEGLRVRGWPKTKWRLYDDVAGRLTASASEQGCVELPGQGAVVLLGGQ